MAHFAEIDNTGIVLRVLVVDNEQEHRGQEFLANDLGLGGTWIQTSYSGGIRKNFAGIGFIYDSELDAFIPPKPFQSWVLDPVSFKWEPPVPYPNDNNRYIWNEELVSWELI